MLESNDIHVWRGNLDQSDSFIEKLFSILSADEKERAGRFQYVRDKTRFIACRAILRTILSRYLGVESRCLEFEYKNDGKPGLKKQMGNETALRFSLSNSHNIALYAVTANREIGIDAEYVRPISDRDEIVERYFAAAERASYGCLTPNEKQRAFFNGWTRKEAYLKAIGVGLNQPLSSVEVSMQPGKPARLLTIDGNPQKAAAWSLYEINLGKDYVGAVAVKGRCGFQLWEWSSS